MDYRRGSRGSTALQPDAIQVERLTKVFGQTRAVDDLSFGVRAGEVYGFLGPNGAGKTTTIYAMLGLVQPTSGQVKLFTEIVTPTSLSLRQRVGFVAEEPLTAPQMTAWELIRFFADLNRVPKPQSRMAELFRALDLWDVRHGLVRDYSRGMRQKLSLIRAFVHRPELLILDEPVSGLDPHGIVQVRDLIEEHRAQGGTAFVSSHILSEIERSADRVGILDRGRLVLEDTVDGLRRRFGQEATIRLELADAPSPKLIAALRDLPRVREVSAVGTGLVVHAEGTHDPRPQIFRTIVDENATLLRMQTDETSLEEAFVTVTSQTISELARVP